MMMVGGTKNHLKSLGITGAFLVLSVVFSGFTGCRQYSPRIQKVIDLVRQANSLPDSTNHRDYSAIISGKVTYFDYHQTAVVQAGFTEWYKSEGKLRIDLNYDEMVVVDSWDGVYGMEKIGGERAERITAKRFVTNLRLKTFAARFLHETRKFIIQPDELVGTDSCYVLAGRYRGHETARYFVNKKDGTLRRYMGRSHYGQPGILQIDLDEYRSVDGIPYPGRIRSYLNGRMYKEEKIESCIINEQIDDLHFNLSRDAYYI
jgi:hypothetical protein